MARRRRRRARTVPRSTIVLRWLAVGGLALVAFLYYRPLRTYVSTRHELKAREAQVAALAAEQAALQRRLQVAQGSQALIREARRLGLVRPGERLYIVKGIQAWRRQQARIGGGG